MGRILSAVLFVIYIIVGAVVASGTTTSSISTQ